MSKERHIKHLSEDTKGFEQVSYPSSREFADICGMEIIISEDELAQRQQYYIEKLHIIEGQLQQESHRYDGRLSTLLETNKELFDSSGALKILAEEFEQVDPLLRNYYLDRYQESSFRSIEQIEEILLRGLAFYITRINQGPEALADLVCHEVYEAQKVINKFVDNEKLALSPQNRIALLAVIDNKKHHLLELLHAVHQSSRYLTKGERLSTEEYDNLLETTYTSVVDFYSLLFYGAFPSPDTEIEALIEIVNSHLKIKIDANRDMDSIIQHSLLKMYREANNPFDSALLVSKLIHHWDSGICWDMVIGIEYGGIELPLVFNAILQLERNTTVPFTFVNATFSSFLAECLDDFHLETDLGNIETLESEEVLLMDDNVVTGRTVDSVVEFISSKGKPSIYFACIGFSTEELLPHMLEPAHGCINPEVLAKMEVVRKAEFLYRKEKGDYYRKGVYNPIEEEVERQLFEHFPNIDFKLQAS